MNHIKILLINNKKKTHNILITDDINSIVPLSNNTFTNKNIKHVTPIEKEITGSFKVS